MLRLGKKAAGRLLYFTGSALVSPVEANPKAGEELCADVQVL
jgi:hypothetical protein